MFERAVPYFASTKPAAPAIWANGKEVSYANLHRDIDKIACAIDREKLAPRSLVLLNVQPLTLHWLFLLALERSGHTSVCTSLKNEGGAIIDALRPAVIISNHSLPGTPSSVRLLRVDKAWVDTALSATNFERQRSPAEDCDVVRVILSSGTTGTPKQVAMLRRAVDLRTAYGAFGAESGQNRWAATMGPDTTGGFRLPLSTWWCGGTAILPQTVTPEVLSHSRADTLLASPRQLQEMLLVAPGAFQGPTKLKVRIVGGATSQPLHDELSRRAGIELEVAYGSTETGSVARGPGELLRQYPNAGGFLLPWAQVQVLSGSGAVLPPGQVGQIRIKTDAMAQGYLHEDRTGTFSEGWFYPGDIGSVNSEGLLVIEGRIDDLLNIGGVKLSPQRVEDAAMEEAGVIDAAALAEHSTKGRAVLLLALHAEESCDIAEVEKAMAMKFRTTVKAVRLNALRRNGMGKLQRTLIRQDVAAALRAAAEKA